MGKQWMRGPSVYNIIVYVKHKTFHSHLGPGSFHPFAGVCRTPPENFFDLLSREVNDVLEFRPIYRNGLGGSHEGGELDHRDKHLIFVGVERQRVQGSNRRSLFGVANSML